MRRSASWLIVCAVLLNSGSVSVLATDVYYSNLQAISPNGLYRATATSPENREGVERRPFQRDFTVEVARSRSGTPLARWRQGPGEESPVELILTDDGTLVFRDADDCYRVISTHGVVSQPVSFFRTIPKREQKLYTARTTAGFEWLEYHKQGFFSDRGTDYYYVRTYWGRIIALDLPQGRLVTSTGLISNIERTIVDEARRWAEQTGHDLYAACPSCGGRHLKSELTENLFIVTQYELKTRTGLVQEALAACADGRNTSLPRYLKRIRRPWYQAW